MYWWIKRAALRELSIQKSIFHKCTVFSAGMEYLSYQELPFLLEILWHNHSFWWIMVDYKRWVNIAQCWAIRSLWKHLLGNLGYCSQMTENEYSCIHIVFTRLNRLVCSICSKKEVTEKCKWHGIRHMEGIIWACPDGLIQLHELQGGYKWISMLIIMHRWWHAGQL